MKAITTYLSISAALYNELLFETGMQKLEIWLGVRSKFVPLVSQLPIYWAWYQNQFELIDNAFLAMHTEPVMGPRHRARLVDTWKEAHSPERMVAYPNSKAINKEIAAFVGKSIDQLHSKEAVNA